MGLLLSEVIVKGGVPATAERVYIGLSVVPEITSFKQTGSPTAKPVIAKSPEFPVTFVPAVIVLLHHPQSVLATPFSFTSSLKEELA